MFRHTLTRFIITNRIVTTSSRNFSRTQQHLIQKSSIFLDKSRWLTNRIQRNKSINTMETKSASSLPKVYTRTGDRGTSALLGSGSHRYPKESLIFDVLGTIDELSATIGIVRSQCSLPSLSKDLENIQCCLFEIGSCVAAKNRSSRYTFNDSSLIDTLEEKIDQMTDELPPLRHFILSGGPSQAASYLHFSRAVCRRCERLVTKWLHDSHQDEEEKEEEEQLQETIMGKYLNRLSDYLFTAARYVAFKEGHADIVYHKSK